MVVLCLGIAVDVVASILTGDWRCAGWLFAIAVIALLNSADAAAYFARPAESAIAEPVP